MKTSILFLGTTCPNDQDDFCPTNQMFAYDFAGEEQMNCLFECPRVTSAPRSTLFSDFDHTGFRCVGVNYPSIQYSWCCRTKQTGGGSSSGGLDKCSDVMSADKLWLGIKRDGMGYNNVFEYTT